MRDFIRATGARLIQGNSSTAIKSISIDTRTLKRGDFFFAIRGPRHDGHEHVNDAVAQGAAGLVVQKLRGPARSKSRGSPVILQVPETITALQNWARYVRRQSAALVIGITGSNGKTTTKEMLGAILRRMGATLSTRGNLNNHLGLPLMLAEAQPEHRFMVLEMGASRPGDTALLASIANPQIGVMTNIGRAHLKGLRSPEGVLKEKRALLEALPPDGTAVLNRDDALLQPLAGALHCQTLTFGLGPQAQVRAEDVQEKAHGLSFTLSLKGRRMPVSVPALGEFQVYNALAACAVACAAGVPDDNIVQGLDDFVPLAMRMQKISHPSGAILIHDAYNANPSSMRAAVESFCRSFPDYDRWLVLGDMRELGPESRREHEQLGAWLVSQPVERVFLYGRDILGVLNGMKSASHSIKELEHFRQRRLLVQKLQRGLAPKVVVLFKGSRAMKLEDIITALQ